MWCIDAGTSLTLRGDGDGCNLEQAGCLAMGVVGCGQLVGSSATLALGLRCDSPSFQFFIFFKKYSNVSRVRRDVEKISLKFEN